MWKTYVVLTIVAGWLIYDWLAWYVRPRKLKSKTPHNIYSKLDEELNDMMDDISDIGGKNGHT